MSIRTGTYVAACRRYSYRNLRINSDLFRTAAYLEDHRVNNREWVLATGAAEPFRL